MTGQHLDFSRALHAAHAGDSDAFGELWRMTGPRLDRYLTVAARDLAEDVATSTWLVVAAGLRSFAGDERAFRGVLARIAREEALARRRLERRPPVAGLPATAGPLAVLSPDVAEMVALRIVIGLDTRETAGLLSTRPGFVTVAVHGGIRRATAAAHPRSAALALPNPWQLDGLLDRLAERDRYASPGLSVHPDGPVLPLLHPAVRGLLAALTEPGPAGDPAQLEAARQVFDRSVRRSVVVPGSSLSRVIAAGGPYVHPQPSF